MQTVCRDQITYLNMLINRNLLSGEEIKTVASHIRALSDITKIYPR